MALVPHKIVALAQSDAEGTGGQNIVAGAVVSLFDSGGVAIQLHDDASGSNPNTVKTTDSNGVRVVWVTPGEYDEAVNGSTLRKVSIGGRSASEVDTFANLQLYRPTNTGQVFICQERDNARYILEADGYSAQFGDVTFANGRVASLQIDGPISVRSFGISTGNQTSALQSLADRMDESMEVFFEDDFSITSTVTFSNGGTVDFGDITIDGTGLPNSTVDRTLNQALVFTGSIGSSTAINANISSGDDTFTAPGAGLVAGDTAIVRSDQTFVDGWAGSANNKRGEIVTIESVSMDTYTVHEPFRFSYDSAQNLRVEKMTPTKTHIKGGTLQMGGVGSEHRGLQLIYARNSKIEGLTVKGAEDTSVSIEYSHTVSYKGECWDATTPTSGFNTGYGVAQLNGSRNIDIDVVGYNCKHVVTSGGFLPSLETTVRGVSYDSGLTTTAFDCHEPCFGWVWDVECYGGNAGIGIRGSEQRVKIKARNLASNAVRVKAFDDPGLQYGVDVDIDSDQTGSTAVLIETDSCPIDDVKITGRVKNTAVNALACIGDATHGIANVKVDVDADGSASRAFDFRFSTGVYGKLRCRNSGERGLQAFDSGNIDLHVDVESSSSNAVYLLRTDDADISGLRAFAATTAAIFTDDCNNIDISITDIEANGGTSDCWRAVDTIGGKLIGSTLTAGRHGVFSSGTSNAFIASLNDARNVTNGDKFNLSGASNVESDNLI